MKQYLLSIYQPDGGPAPPEVLEPIMRDLAVLNEEMKDAGAWVFAGGLHPPSQAVELVTRDAPEDVEEGPMPSTTCKSPIPVLPTAVGRRISRILDSDGGRKTNFTNSRLPTTVGRRISRKSRL